jgi:curved DNA-binding protein CbpA
MADLYQLLGVQRTATNSEIKSAYRRLARKYHPDVNREPTAARRFAQINEAYHVLSDPQRRALYDAHGTTRARGSAPTATRTVNYARATRRAYYQARADRAVNEWLARERAEMRERGHAVYTTVTLFLSTFMVALFKPGILETSNPFLYGGIVVVFAASIWYLGLSLKRHFDHYTYRQEMMSVLRVKKTRKPFSRGVALAFVGGGYLISVALGFLMGAMAEDYKYEEALRDGLFSVLFYPPIAVLIVDMIYFMHLRLEEW